ncbi:MAG: alpha/beta hydrolase [Deltaproteobacteria bacterium]|nr:alpha/beta hydrolase [Deltaproteobacteria bacterium]MBW1848370.1 alpha/beta hydrolase [Deltaproteobacteria bacterium]MBW2179112.1 alpha/beta hydrolase [Deltaproteobacteria bacterium]MBW2365109.1 alpha/beta hydrolase [Deltaproteobacteria bacterium]
MAITFPDPKIYQTNDINMEVYELGEGFPVILAHGFPELAYSWRFQIPALADAGYRVIAPNQRGYGATDKPEPVEAYDIHHLCGDMAGLLDTLGLEKAIFIGHDWGGPVVWNMPLLHPDRVAGVVGMSVPFMPRGDHDPVALMEQFFGPEHYIVHFNRQPGVADAAFAANPKHFFNNVFRQSRGADQSLEPSTEEPSFNVSLMALLDLTDPPGKPLMSEEEMDVFVTTFSKGGFTGPINWYRNITRNWETSANLPQRIDVPCAIIFGEYDIVPKGGDVSEYVPNLETITLECGHWIQQEKPEEVNTFLLDWLKQNTPS